MDLEVRALSQSHNLKISIVDLSESVQEIIKLQDSNSLASIALGKLVIANCLIGADLKENNKVTSNINGAGLAGTMIAEFQNKTVRGYIQVPNFDLNEIKEKDGSPLSQVVGKIGFLQVSKDINMKEPYISKVQIVNGEINIDYMYLLNQSDQVPSLISSLVELNEANEVIKAAGIMIQMLPGHSEADIEFLEEKLGSLDHLLDTLKKTTVYEELIKDIASDAKILEVNQLKYKCTCSKDKVLATILLLGEDELQNIINTDEFVEVVCDFCKLKYNISGEEIKKII
ncbi:heat shock protein 33 [Spiroplasma sabaudiense Ar-1343]|uniref:Heat shock protein 33 n=1 Tax=Spiroplasma sabaudiense Ar-1343 TaxID=1276257 RepID=W6A8Y4_9MOLU|nr:Hsp33 family molecular chaperone HslO [Spiroplasma sabaudiense]AHI53426.1 heat shock protein 33 [Spiroplasma sabaudiense Ar-1343]